MAGVEGEFERGVTVRGIDLKESILLQAALRGYLARRLISKHLKSLTPSRDDIVTELNEIPAKLVKLTKSILANAGPFTRTETADSHDTFTFGPVQFTDDSVYQGSWSRDSKRCGFGVQYWPNGKYYEGEWQNDLFSGKGRLVYENKDLFEGDFTGGLPNGKGKLIGADGSSYSGDWANGLKHGKGKEVSANGDTYNGQFNNGQIEGRGVFTLHDKSNSYEGQWKGGKKHGEGKMTWDDNKTYTGGWRNNLQHGEGTLTDGSMTRRGEWNSGRRVKWL